MTELERQAEEVLRRVGVEAGHSVLDFGCGSGTYAIPAAHLVGGNEGAGKVYAVDKAWWGMWPGEGLAKLAQRVEAEHIQNIRIMKTSGKLRIDLDDASVDVALLHDVVHSYYFSLDQIQTVVQEISRVLRTTGFLSLYPGDPQLSGDIIQLRKIEEAIEQAGFRLEAEYALDVVHESTIVRGQVKKFTQVRGP